MANQTLTLERKDLPILADARLRSQISDRVASNLKPVAYYQPIAPLKLDSSLPGEGQSYRLPLSSINAPLTYLVKPATNNGDGLIAYNGKLFRGAICLQATNTAGNAINVINILDMEDYLFSVVPSEMPSAWPLEAFKSTSKLLLVHMPMLI